MRNDPVAQAAYEAALAAIEARRAERMADLARRIDNPEEPVRDEEGKAR